MSNIRIFMVDDHRTMTDGLSEYLRAISNETQHYQVVGRVQNGRELLARLGAMPAVDVILMDLEMPEMSGFELLDHILVINPHIPVIVLTMHNSWAFASQLIQKGARGYLLKTSGGKAVTDAIQLVLQHKIYIDPSINPAGVSEPPAEWNPEDRKIICLIVKEYTSEQIAHELGYSVEHIENRRRAIMRQINAKNMVGIVKYALQKKVCQEIELPSEKANTLVSPTNFPTDQDIRVLLVDDHILITDSIEAMLSNTLPNMLAISVAGKVHDGAQTLDFLHHQGPVDLVLLDKELPDMNGIELIGRIHALYPELPCLMLSFDGSLHAKETALAAGAVGYLVKTKATRELIIQSIYSAVKNGSPMLASHTVQTKDIFDATDQKIIALILEEQNNEAIAESLGISVSTVGHRRSKMIETIGARSIIGLVVWAIRKGL